MLMPCCWPPLKYGCGAKVSGFGLAVRVPVMPEPVSGTSSVPESSVSSNDALFAPALFAWKVTCTLQEPPGGSNAPGQVLEFS